jgi:hypothetical protein
MIVGLRNEHGITAGRDAVRTTMRTWPGITVSWASNQHATPGTRSIPVPPPKRASELRQPHLGYGHHVHTTRRRLLLPGGDP